MKFRILFSSVCLILSFCPMAKANQVPSAGPSSSCSIARNSGAQIQVSYSTCEEYYQILEGSIPGAGRGGLGSVDASGCSGKPDTALCVKAVMAINKCMDSTRDAVDTCDTNKSKDMMSVNNILAMGGQAIAGAQASQQTACSSLGKILPLVSAGIGAFQGYCSRGYLSCSSDCDDAAQVARDFSSKGYADYAAQIRDGISDAKKDCQGLQAILASAAQNAAVAVSSLFNTQQCEDGSQDMMAKFCAQNQGSSICGQLKASVDCNDPNNAYSNTICVCQRNPRDSRCGTNANSGTLSSSSSGGAGGKDGTSTSAGSGLESGSMGVDPFGGVQPGQAKPAGTANLQGGGPGRQGGGISSGGTGSSGGGAQAGAGAGGLNTKVLGGYMGGSGGGYANGSGSGRGSGEDSGSGSYGRGNGTNVNLNKMFPGGVMDPKRNLAGVTGPDGLTGPNSSNWDKVNIRYGSKTGTFHP